MPNYCKYYKKKKQVSYDSGTTWVDVVPYEYEKGDLYESYSPDCGVITQYRWVVMSGASDYICDSSTHTKYRMEKKQVSYDNGQTWADVSPLETRKGAVMEYYSEDCGYEEPLYKDQYFSIESLVDNNEIRYASNIGSSSQYFYAPISASTDNGRTWRSVTLPWAGYPQTIATLNAGEKVLIKGNNAAYTKVSRDGIYYTYYFDISKPFNAYGNIMSLINGDLFYNTSAITESNTFEDLFRGTSIVSAENLVMPTTTTNYCYWYMFQNCTGLTTAPTLPATALSMFCYAEMFEGCTSLTTVQATLPASTLATYCCWSMFDGCTSLTTAPALPATTLADHCYLFMFEGCTSLTAAPELPATNLNRADSCYHGMFQGCTSLTASTALSATTLASGCYGNMFNGCTSLTTAPVLPATTLASGCYQGMFQGCTSLVTPPSLPATTLADNCYYSMFAGCTSIVIAPVLPATSTVTGCYTYMFWNCTSLTTVPEISATFIKGRQNNESLVKAACCKTFLGCSNLSYIKCLATSVGFAGTVYWVDGVAANGTFVKSSAASWGSGVHGIPSNWTVQNA